MSENKRTPQANIAPFGLRMQPELRARIEEAARANERSMNAEIVARLQDSFDPEGLAEIRAQLVAMGRQVSVLERSQKATGDASQITRLLADMYEKDISDLQETMSVIAIGARIIGDAVAKAAEGDPWDLRAIVATSNPVPSDESPASDIAALVKALASSPTLSAPFADALKAGNMEEATRLLQAIDGIKK